MTHRIHWLGEKGWLTRLSKQQYNRDDFLNRDKLPFSTHDPKDNSQMGLADYLLIEKVVERMYLTMGFIFADDDHFNFREEIEERLAKQSL